MKQKQNRLKRTITLILLAACIGTAYGQVTIGAGIKPVNGALLDLKEQTTTDGSVNATKGLMLPRVTLTDPNKLYPMFENATQPGTPAADYDDTAKKKAQDDIHTGLTVYNLGQCDGKFARGVYTWTGTEWIQLTTNPILTGGNPTLTFNPALPADNMIYIPSGQDGRGISTATPINFTWGNATGANWSNLVDNSNGSMSGGLTFNDAGSGLTPAGVPDLTGTGTWTTPGASALTITPDNLSSIVTANPWATRQSKVTISVPAGIGGGPGSPCPGGTDQTQVITLNQTNYKIVPSTSTSDATSGITPTSFVVLRDISAANLPIHSNVRWKATTTASAAQLAKVLGSADLTNATVKGDDKSDGTKYTPLTEFNYQSVAAGNAVKYETVDVTYEDVNVPKRAPDITVTFMQCQGLEDMSSAIKADNAATATTPAPIAWAGKVVKHEAKAGVYAEFYSAEFGSAGRWMTTNLAAESYDGTHNAGRSLTGPNANSGSLFNAAYWCYPNGGPDGDTETDYKNNPYTGFLYTWDAATAGKGGSSGQGNSANQGNTDHAQVQGICPKEWHLPSDKEWNQLEKQIYENPELYSSYTNKSTFPYSGQWNTTWETVIAAYRPATGSDGQGRAMLDVCGVNPYKSEGRSNQLKSGGFSVLTQGLYEPGNAGTGWSEEADFWTSSSYNASNAYHRYFAYNEIGVWRDNTGRDRLLSVRCKKN